MKRLIAAVALTLTLAGCADTYRYPCQNPANATKLECQCDQTPRTKNKALGAIETGTTTTTIARLVGLDC